MSSFLGWFEETGIAGCFCYMVGVSSGRSLGIGVARDSGFYCLLETLCLGGSGR